MDPCPSEQVPGPSQLSPQALDLNPPLPIWFLGTEPGVKGKLICPSHCVHTHTCPLTFPAHTHVPRHLPCTHARAPSPPLHTHTCPSPPLHTHVPCHLSCHLSAHMTFLSLRSLPCHTPACSPPHLLPQGHGPVVRGQQRLGAEAPALAAQEPAPLQRPLRPAQGLVPAGPGAPQPRVALLPGHRVSKTLQDAQGGLQWGVRGGR